MASVGAVRNGGKWKEDETTELLSYYKKCVRNGTFKKMVKRNQAFADHINNMFYKPNMDKGLYSEKTADNVSDKLRHSKALYEKYRKKFKDTMRQMTETGRETEELDQEKCQEAWAGWSLYHEVFGDDVTIDNPNIAEAGLPQHPSGPSQPGSESASPEQQPEHVFDDDVGDDDPPVDPAPNVQENLHEQVQPDAAAEGSNDEERSDSDSPSPDGASQPHASKRAKTAANGVKKAEFTPRTMGKEARVLEKVAEQFTAMSDVKVKISKENRDVATIHLEMQLKHEREMFELKCARDDARITAILDRKHAHEEKIFSGLIDILRASVTHNNPGPSSSVPFGQQ